MPTYIKKITVATPNRIPQVLTDINNLQGIDTSNESNNDILVFDSASGNIVPRDSATLTNITVSGSITPSGTIAGNLIPSADSTYSLGDSNNKWRSLHVSGQTIFLGSLSLKDEGGSFSVTSTSTGNTIPSSNALDSSRTIDLVDSAYVQARQLAAVVDSASVALIVDSDYVQLRQDKAYSSLTGAPTIPAFGTDFVDSSYVSSVLPTLGTDFVDSGQVTSIVDSAYILARAPAQDFLDSAEAISLIDSAHIRARQIQYTIPTLGGDFVDSAYVASQIPTLGGNFVDSAEVVKIVTANAIDSSVALQLLLDSIETIALIDSAYVRARQIQYTIPTLGSDFIDSGGVTTLVDSAYVQARQVDLQRDSAFVTGIVDSAYILARAPAQDFLDSAEAIALIDRNHIINTGQLTGVVTESSGGTFSDVNNSHLLFHDDVKIKIGTDSDHTLSFTGNETKLAGSPTVVIQSDSDISFTTTSNAQMLLARAGGSVILHYNGVEKFRTRDSGVDVTGSLEADSATIAGLKFPTADGLTNQVVTTDGSGTLRFASVNALAGGLDSATLLALIDSAYLGNIVDSNFVAALITATGVNVQDEGTPLSTTGSTLNFVGAGVTATGSGATKTITISGAGTVDSADVIALIDSAYVQARQTASGVDSAATIALIDSAYVQARQTASGVDSSATLALIDSAYVLARAPAQTTADFPDSAGVNTLIDARVNGTFINNLTIDADTLGGQAGSYYLNYNNFTNTPTIPTLGGDFVDSSFVIANSVDSAEVIALIDSAYVQLRQSASSSGVDSAATIALIDSDYIKHRTRIGLNDIDFGSNKILYANVYDSPGAFPSASTYHGMFAHAHSTGAGYFAHGGVWLRLANYDQLPAFGTDYVDSGAVSTLITSTVTSSYIQTRQGLIDSSLVTQLVDSAYVALRDKFNDSAGVLQFVDSDYVQLRQDKAYSSLTGAPTIPTLGGDFVDSAYVTSVLPTIGADFVDSAFVLANSVDSAEVIALIDSAYVQARQSATGGTDFIFKTIAVAGQSSVVADTTTDTLTLAGGDNVTITTDAASDTVTFTATVPSFGTDYVDSGAVNTLIDTRVNASFINALTIDADTLGGQSGSYYLNYNNFSNTPTIPTLGTDFIDSAQAILLIDSAYVQARQTDVRDSAFVTGIVDSAYVAARVSIPSLGADFVDSSEVNTLIDTRVNASFINGLTIDADTLGGQAGSYYLNYTNFSNTPTIPTLGGDFVDSAIVSSLITSTVTSGYVQARQDLIDSSLVTQLVDSAYVALRDKFNDSDGVLQFVDSDYVQARQDKAYSSLTGAPSIPAFGTDFIDSAAANTLIDTRVDATFINNLTIDADTLGGQAGSYYLNYNNFTNTPTIPTLGGDFVDSGLTINLIDSAYVQARTTAGTDSAATISLITATVDSDYVQLRSHDRQAATTLSTAGANQVVDQFSKTTFRTSKYMVEIKDSAQNHFHSSEVLLTHNGTSVFMTEYAVVRSQDSDIGTIDASISGDNVRLTVTTTRNNIKVKTSRTSMEA